MRNTLYRYLIQLHEVPMYIKYFMSRIKIYQINDHKYIRRLYN